MTAPTAAKSATVAVKSARHLDVMSQEDTTAASDLPQSQEVGTRAADIVGRRRFVQAEQCHIVDKSPNCCLGHSSELARTEHSNLLSTTCNCCQDGLTM
eukprot:17135-Heterococcus_DN1.PRE.2